MSTLHGGVCLDIWEGERVVLVAYLGDEKGRLKIVNAAGREMRIPESRLACATAFRVDPGAGAVAIGRRLAAFEAELVRDAEAVDLKALWEILADESGQYSLEELAELALGSREGSALSLMLRSLIADTFYFTRKKLAFAPRTREELDETLRKRQREGERARLREAFLATARAYLDAPDDVGPSFAAGAERFLDSLRDVAIHGLASERIKEAERLLGELGVAGRADLPMLAFEVLVRLRVFAPDENLLVARHAIETSFPPEIEAEAARVAALGAPHETWRRDLRGLGCYAIDDPQTTEVDDAISLEPLAGERWRFGIHIADPTPYVRFGEVVDLEARKRATTYYLPEQRMLMLPPVISEGVASLLADSERPALSFLVELDGSGQVLSHELVHSTIRINRRLSYEDTDLLVALGGGAPRLDEPLEGFAVPAPSAQELASLPAVLREDAELAACLAQAARLARALLERRAEAGALILKGPDLDVKVRDGVISVRRFEPWTAAWILVSESMILANQLAASFFVEHKLPAIFRRQAASDQKLSVSRGYDPVAMAAIRRQLKRTEIGLEPGPHAGLGLPAYVQVTSPLRRYQDLALHHQLRAVLAGEPPRFDAEALWRVAASSDLAEKTAREVERGTREYWLYRYFESLPPDHVFEAVITRAEERRTLVELCDYAYLTTLVPRSGHKPGRKLSLVIDAVNPRAGRLVLRDVSRD